MSFELSMSQKCPQDQRKETNIALSLLSRLQGSKKAIIQLTDTNFINRRRNPRWKLTEEKYVLQAVITETEKNP